MERPFEAYKGDEPYLFVCYSHEDSVVVYPELQWLHEQGVNVWYDEGISAGSNWLARIGDSLTNASHVLFYISEHSLQSDHCNREINFSLNEGKTIIPVYLSDVELTSDLKVGLNRIQALQREQNADYQNHLLQALAPTAEFGQVHRTLPEKTQQTAVGDTTKIPLRRRLRRQIHVPWMVIVAVVSSLIGALVMYSINMPNSALVNSSPILRVPLPLAGWEDWKSIHPAPSMIISPDGNTVVFVSRDERGGSKLQVRHLDQMGSVELAGTDGAENPFFSPNGRWVGYFDDKLMKRVSLSNNELPGIITTLNRHTHGATWGQDNRIYYAETYSGLQSVPASGGIARNVTKLDVTRREGGHRAPHFVAGHQVLLLSIYLSDKKYHEIWAHSLITGERVYLFDGLAPVYIDSGYILYAKVESGIAGSLWAVPFDPMSMELKGRPQPIQNAVAGRGGTAFAAAHSDKLIYLPKQGELVGEVVLLESNGLSVLAQGAGFHAPAFSNDGKKISIVEYEEGKGPSIKIIEIESGVMRQFADDGSNPLWDPDDQSITFSKYGVGLMRQPLGGAKPAEIIVSEKGAIMPDAWLSQGQTLIYTAFPLQKPGSVRSNTMEMVSSNPGFGYALESDHEPRQLLGQEASYLSFTNDEKWVSFSTWPRGVLVAPFADDTIAVTATVSGHTSNWNNDNSRLYYQDFNKLWAVDVDLSAGVSFGKRDVIANLGYPSPDLYDVDKNGRIVFVRHRNLESHPPVLIMNWERMLDDER
jgi:hypothetical protein